MKEDRSPAERLVRDTIWQIRNELVHSGKRVEPHELISILVERGIQLHWSHLDVLLSGDLLPDYRRIPPELVEFLAQYLAGRKIRRALDPWAGAGALLTGLVDTGAAAGGLGITRSTDQIAIARLISRAQSIEWQLGDPFEVIETELGKFDLIVSCPPFGMPSRQWGVETTQGELRVRDSAGFVLALKACTRLAENGEGVFLLPDGFFTRRRSGVLETLPKLGLSVHTVLSIPDPAILLGWSVPTSIVFIKHGVSEEWFIGRIADDPRRNTVLLENVKSRTAGEDIGLGRLVDPKTYRGYDGLEAADRVERMAPRLGLEGRPLTDMVQEINLTKASGPPGFEERPNAVYLPRRGRRDAVFLLSQLELKPHNYVQLVLDPQVAEAEYVAAFFSTPLGLAIRDQACSGATIPKISKKALEHVQLFLPDRQAQLETIAAVSRIRILASELQELTQRVWAEPKQLEKTMERLGKLAREEQREERFADWIDTLPFPLASILWASHASGDDDKKRYEHLLHFFEALSEFMATVLLSGIRSDEKLFRPERDALSEILQKQSLSLERSSFGTWKAIVERLAKVVRTLRSDRQERSRCEEMFRTSDDGVFALLSSRKLVGTLQETNNLRNSWIGHGGIVSDRDARERYERLKSHLATVREAFGTVWERWELIVPGVTTVSSGVYKYEVRRLIGNRTPFEIVSLEMEHPLEDGQLHLISSNERRALHLLPLVKVMHPPETAHNACYFYNRQEAEGLLFVSYHFDAKAQIVEEFADTVDVLRLLTTTGSIES